MDKILHQLSQSADSVKFTSQEVTPVTAGEGQSCLTTACTTKLFYNCQFER